LPGFQKEKGSGVDHERHREGRWKGRLRTEDEGHGPAEAATTAKDRTTWRKSACRSIPHLETHGK